MSPWTDLTASGESYDTNYERDPLFGKTRDSLIYNRDYVGDHDRWMNIYHRCLAISEDFRRC